MTARTDRVDRMEKQLESVIVDVKGLGHRMSRLEVLHQALRGDVRLVAEVQARHGAAIEEIRDTLEAIRVGNEGLGARVEKVDGGLQGLRSAVDAIRVDLADVRALRPMMTECIAFAREVLDNHERRLAAIENRASGT